MDIGKFRSRGDGKGSDFRNQGASAIGVDIGSDGIQCADFANAGEGLQALQQVGRLFAEMQAQKEAARDRALESARECRGQ